MKIFAVQIIDSLTRTKKVSKGVFILETQLVWSKERLVMSTEDLKDWK